MSESPDSENKTSLRLEPLTGTWMTECSVCGKKWPNHCGSTPCCGGLAFITSHSPDVVSVFNNPKYPCDSSMCGEHLNAYDHHVLPQTSGEPKCGLCNKKESQIRAEKNAPPPQKLPFDGIPAGGVGFEERVPDYDLSIHSNPDALAWAKFFRDTASELLGQGQDASKLICDEDWMHDWFANAMMAMHDHLQGKPPEGATQEQKRIAQLTHAIQKARDWFIEYADMHVEKGKMVKVAANGEKAQYLTRVLKTPVDDPQPSPQFHSTSVSEFERQTAVEMPAIESPAGNLRSPFSSEYHLLEAQFMALAEAVAPGRKLPLHALCFAATQNREQAGEVMEILQSNSSVLGGDAGDSLIESLRAFLAQYRTEKGL